MLGLPLVLFALSGCGKDPNLPELVPVSGTVTWNDQPLSGAVVTFIPIEETRGSGASSRTGADGGYRLSAAAGKYHVVISKLRMPDGSDFPIGTDLAPVDSGAREVLPSYSDRERPRLSATVPAPDGAINFVLRTDGPKP